MKRLRPKPVRRRAALSPQERVAALLGRKETALACEELALRARADIDAGRTREATLQLRVALETALAELGDGGAAIANRVADLRERQPAVVKAAATAVAGQISEEQTAEVAETLRRLEAALRTRESG